MEKNTVKVSLGTVVCIVIILILLAVIGYLLLNHRAQKNVDLAQSQYNEPTSQEVKQLTNTTTVDKQITETANTLVKNNNEEKIIENKKEVIPTTDLFTLCFVGPDDILLAYIENGYLYYRTSLVPYIDDSSDMIKYTELNNIKRIKTYNIGTSVNPVPFLITEDGKVYYINYFVTGFQVKIYEPFKDYQVEDILSHTGEMYDEFELLLKDGSTVTGSNKDSSDILP